MTKFLIASIFLFCACFCEATNKETVYVIEVADFHCKYCLDSEVYVGELKHKVKENGDKFIFAPIAFNRKNKALELLYYAIKDNSKHERFVRERMFNIAQTSRLKIESLSELIDYLKITESNSISLVDEIEKELLINATTLENVKAYMRAEHLIERAKVDKTPTFLIVTSSDGVMKVKRSPEMSVKDYIDHTLQTYLRISKNET